MAPRVEDSSSSGHPISSHSEVANTVAPQATGAGSNPAGSTIHYLLAFTY